MLRREGHAADVDALQSTFRRDAVFATGRDVVRGHRQLETFFSAAFTALRLELELVDLPVDGNRVAIQLRERIEDGDQLRTDAIAAFYEVEDGLIQSAKVYREGSADV